MLDKNLKAEHIIEEHHAICPDIYQSFDMSMTPARYRKMPGKNSSMNASLTAADKAMIEDPHNQEMFRQWSISGDPIADAFAAKFHEIGHGKALQMLDTALEKGIEHVDDAPIELVNLIRHVEQTPDWVDFDVINETAEAVAPVVTALSQTAWRAGFVLTFGNSYQGLPMVLTGGLHRPETTPGRIKETMSAAWYFSVPDGLRRFGEVFKIVVKVRVMHALVRVNLLRSPDRWDVATYGVPIPMADMYGTFSITAPALKTLQKLKGKKLDITAVRYGMWLMGIDERMPYATVEDMCNVKTQLAATLNHRYEPWASELTEASMNAYLRPDNSLFDKMMDKADKQFSELVITKLIGEKIAGELGVSSGMKNYVSAAFILIPVAAKYTGLRMIELLPGGKDWVQNYCRQQAEKLVGIVQPKYQTNPETYRSLEESAA